MVSKKEAGEWILILILVVSLALVPTVLAITTPLEFRGYPSHNLSAYIINSNDGTEIAFLMQEMNSSGITTINLDSGAVGFYIAATIRKDGKIIRKGTYGNYTAGNKVYINLNEEIPLTSAVTEYVENTTEESAENSIEAIIEEPASEELAEETTTTEPSPETKITGKSIFSGESILAKKWYIIIIAAVLFASLIMFFVIKKTGFLKSPENIKFRKYSEIKDEIKSKKDEYSLSREENKKLLEAEKKIKEAQEEIEKIKNKENKIREAEKKFEEARVELERARKEYK